MESSKMVLMNLFAEQGWGGAEGASPVISQ